MKNAGSAMDSIGSGELYYRGCALETGDGVEKDPARAVDCCREAAELEEK